jgi:enamine deaminase RidA (YjgF/YER057c/UK114 family)
MRYSTICFAARFILTFFIFTLIFSNTSFSQQPKNKPMSVIEEKLSSLGVTLPTPAKPLAAYVPAVQAGNFIFTSGQLPFVDGQLIQGGKGKVGTVVGKEEAKAAARVCAINALAAIKQLIGDLDKIERVVKLTVFVASESGFTEQPFVGNGASEFFKDVFGENGTHARSAVGVAELPLGASVEVEVTVLLKP